MFMEQSLYLQKLFLYRTEDGKGVFEEIEQEAINRLKNYKESAPSFFESVDIVGYVKDVVKIIEESVHEEQLSDEEASSVINDEWYKNFIEVWTNYIVSELCLCIAKGFFESLGNGNVSRGQRTFEEVFLENSSNYEKFYKQSSEFREFCDSMSDANKKRFRRLRNFDMSPIFNLRFQIFKWSFIIAFWFISIPYYIIKKVVNSYKKVAEKTDILKSQEIREVFFILSKTSVY